MFGSQPEPAHSKYQLLFFFFFVLVRFFLAKRLKGIKFKSNPSARGTTYYTIQASIFRDFVTVLSICFLKILLLTSFLLVAFEC